MVVPAIAEMNKCHGFNMEFSSSDLEESEQNVIVIHALQYLQCLWRSLSGRKG